MTKQLTVAFEHGLTMNSATSDVARRLQKIERQALSFAPWPAYTYKPDVRFSIAYGEDAIFLQFEVKEKFIRAAYGHTNEPVYKDSCVEFFISFDEGATYYNFEFNCIGTILAGYGKEKTVRQPLPLALLEKIKSEVMIRRGGQEQQVQWEITLLIPVEVFLHHPLSSLQGQLCRANFYKCGDELPEPHFLSWSNIESDETDFHLPEFFGTMRFLQ